MKLIKFFVLSALSAGWLLPLYLAFNAFRGYLVTELEPKIVGKPLTHSFGMLDQCGVWLEIHSFGSLARSFFGLFAFYAWRPRAKANFAISSVEPSPSFPLPYERKGEDDYGAGFPRVAPKRHGATTGLNDAILSGLPGGADIQTIRPTCQPIVGFGPQSLEIEAADWVG